MGGIAAAIAVARERSGTQFDPRFAALVQEQAAEIFEGLDSAHAWDAVVTAEPALAVVLSEEEFDAALLAIANFIDLKSPFTLGHSAAVAEVIADAGGPLGLSAADVKMLRRAGWVHDFGRLGVSNSIWDKPGPLGAGEWERVRMHPYITERMLHQSAALAPLGAIAVQHRERLDGSGYPRGIGGSAISMPARLLAAADAYQAMREPRPHRAAHSADEAAKLLRADVRGGRLAGDAVEAVLEASGHRARRRPEGPSGLTPREIQVLQESFRVLKPGGRLRALEHVRSPAAFPGFLMTLSNPLWLLMNKQGCCWNRNPLGDIEATGFQIDDVAAFKRFDTVMPAFPMRQVKAHKGV